MIRLQATATYLYMLSRHMFGQDGGPRFAMQPENFARALKVSADRTSVAFTRRFILLKLVIERRDSCTCALRL